MTPRPTTVTETEVQTETRAGSGTGGRVAVVTGGSTGVGNAVCELLLRNGSRVFSVDRGPTVERPEFHSHDVDVRDEDAVAAARETLLATWRAPDLVVVNAGLYRSASPWANDAIDWDELFDVSARGIVETVRVFLPDLLAAADDGELADLVMVGAIPSEGDYADSTVFSAAAAGMARFMSGLRSKYQHRGLRVTHVAPGFVDTAEVRSVNPDDSNTDAAPVAEENLRPADIAEVIGYALDQPPQVSIGEVVLVATTG